MANVSIKFNNKEFLLSCDDGQEEHLEAAETLNAQTRAIQLRIVAHDFLEDVSAPPLIEQEFALAGHGFDVLLGQEIEEHFLIVLADVLAD